MTNQIAIVLTSHTTFGDTGKPTGFWDEELAAPFYIFTDAGKSAEIFSVNGGAAQPDPLSLKREGGRGPVVDRFLADPGCYG
jgi:putative intracellular protease/amidase